MSRAAAVPDRQQPANPRPAPPTPPPPPPLRCRVSFGLVFHHDSGIGGFALFVDVMFILDIYQNLRTGVLGAWPAPGWRVAHSAPARRALHGTSNERQLLLPSPSTPAQHVTRWCLRALPADARTLRVEMRRREIAAQYWRSWLVFDILAAIPYGWITGSPVALLQLTKVGGCSCADAGAVACTH